MLCTNIVLVLSIASVGIVFSAPAPQKLRLQPELDKIDVGKYLKSERLMRLQFKCLIFDGPCDIVGRWAKPRAKDLLLGNCNVCTETQKGWVSDWHDILTEKFPDMYRAAVAKYIQNEGIEIAEEEKEKIREAFREDGVANYLENIKGIDKASTATKSTTTSTTTNENGGLKNGTATNDDKTATAFTSAVLENDELQTTTEYMEDSTQIF